MSKKQQKPDTSPLTITFTIDPALKLNALGERVMATTIIARRGDVAQISALDVTNWKQDLPAEIDNLVRMLLGGQLILPAFPNMGDAKTAGGETATADEPNESELGDAEQDDQVGDVEAADTQAMEEVDEEQEPIAEPALDESLQPDSMAEIDADIYEDEPVPVDEPEFEDELPPAA